MSLTISEIIAILLTRAENNEELIEELIEQFIHYNRFKKGDTDAVVLQGRELFEEVLQKHFK